MKKKRFGIERRDLSATSTTDLKRMAHYAHTVGETLAQADISSDVEILADLETAVHDGIADMGAVLLRVEHRIAEELASRN
jgi:hypothetical protein